MKKLLSAIAVLALLLCVIFPPAAHADGKLDEIENYQITVDMREDGTMDIRYHIDWKVLDDTSEGPLTWVKIGIPNRYVDTIKALNSSIKEIGYLNDGGDYVRIDLDRAYMANEIVPLDFSIHLSHMYTLDQKNGVCSYRFTPGWFDGSDVKSLKIRWNDQKVMRSDAAKTDDRYLVWAASLAAGERFSVSVQYPLGAFAVSDDGQVRENTGVSGSDGQVRESTGDSDGSVGGVFVIIIIVITVIAIMIRRVSGGGGGGYRGGFGTRGVIGGGHCACVSSCACACACACAGGGRAGCSAKNFYGSAVRIDAVIHKFHDTHRSDAETY